MRLHDFVDEKFDGNVTRFARAVGRTQSTARKWLLPKGHPHRTMPDPEAVLAIYRVSGGLIAPNDLYELPKLRNGNGART